MTELMNGKVTPQEIANLFGFPIAMNCYSSGHQWNQSNGDWFWYTTIPFIDGENDCWAIKRGTCGRIPYGLLDSYTGDWKDSLAIPEHAREERK